jgi:ABC-type dipeptide/oligopeptide/nickel transport system ATPase component
MATPATLPSCEVEDLSIALPSGGDRSTAVRNVSFTVGRGEIVCLVGESGSGKVVIAQSVMGLLPKSLPVTSGQHPAAGRRHHPCAAVRLRELRATRMSMIFQEPMTALNPVMTCGDQIDEVLREHTKLSPPSAAPRCCAIIEEVLLPDPERMVASYPHQLSGGQRQRIMIAMALVLDPVLLIADEPTTALDVTTQAQILKLVLELQRRHGTGVLFITHDFGVVAEVAHRVAVLRLGDLVEVGDKPTCCSARSTTTPDADRRRAHAAPERAPADASRAGGAEGARPGEDLPRQGLVRQGAHRARGAGRELRDPPRPDAGHRGRIGLGQEHGGALHRAPDRPQRRRGQARHRPAATKTSHDVGAARCARCASGCRSSSRTRTARSTRAAPWPRR